MASAEPTFDLEQDAWFDLDLHHTNHGERVQLEKRDLVRHGDVSNWLTSEAFDLKEARSIEGEKAVRTCAWRFSRRKDSRPCLKLVRLIALYGKLVYRISTQSGFAGAL